MGILQFNQIKHRLEQDIVPWIASEDLAGHRAEQREKHVLSRALAAFVVYRQWGWDAEAAAACVTDGGRDGGLDVIAVDPDGPRLLLVQSKWSDGGGSASKDEMLVFREGVDRLISGDWGYFSDAIQARRDELEEVLYDPAVSIELCFAHTGSGQLAPEVEQEIKPLLADLNELEDVATFEYWGQAILHSKLASPSGDPITLNVELSDWGMLDGPVGAFYGHVSASAVAQWHRDFGDLLFESNLRSTLPNTGVNDAISTTIREQPELFWYFNNGVTVLCRKISKAPVGGADRRLGHFVFTGSQVVNGAQTVGSIARSLDAENAESGPGRVMVRFIELEGADDDFGRSVTRWTNTQNRVGGREFLALDPEQARLAAEFQLDDRRYVFRSGEDEPAPEKGCGVQEATVALACMEGDIRLAVQAKREVSRLWADVEKAPYKVLFNGGTHSTTVWRAVQTMRCVDERLRIAQDAATGGRQRNFLAHLNRITLWLVNQKLGLKGRAGDPGVNWDDVLVEVSDFTDSVCAIFPEVAEAMYPGYPANLAKNAHECQRIADQVMVKLASSEIAGVVEV